jgi:hypothetical protein
MRYKKLFRWSSILTITLPLFSLMIYFFITMNSGVTILLESPKVTFIGMDEEYNYIEDPEDIWSVDFETNKITFDYDQMVFNKMEIRNGELTINIPELFYMGNDFYSFDEENELVKINSAKLIEESMFQKNFIIGSYIVIMGISVSLIGMIVLKKMDILKRHRRLSVLVFSINLTLIFFLLSAITTEFFLVFMTFTFAWAVYYLEWIIYRKANGLPLHDEISQRVVMVDE